ncbi:unnamed protein product [Linum tenue]|uniref:Pyridine nucleotide-disulphide oxidoreductase N-terminal domain-containing protein n=1 Tax=Linum tenue TaxID=586396 RepID=A0AAV0HW80_9ROSI|nr:unnamed protein product [Linum tenue]
MPSQPSHFFNRTRSSSPSALFQSLPISTFRTLSSYGFTKRCHEEAEGEVQENPPGGCPSSPSPSRTSLVSPMGCSESEKSLKPPHFRLGQVCQQKRKARIAVVGGGPSGLFASLVLAELGADVTLMERGQPVEQTGRDIGALIVRWILESESNFCFGEVHSCLLLPLFLHNLLVPVISEGAESKSGCNGRARLCGACAESYFLDDKLSGFISEEALLHSVKTRTSSPVQIPLGEESYESLPLKWLYPVGEGAGCADGIASTAVDGMQAAFAAAKNFGLFPEDMNMVLSKAERAWLVKYWEQPRISKYIVQGRSKRQRIRASNLVSHYALTLVSMVPVHSVRILC